MVRYYFYVKFVKINDALSINFLSFKSRKSYRHRGSFQMNNIMLKVSMINLENWTHCNYINNDFKAIISFGSGPELSDDEFEYFVTVIDKNNNEIHQDAFNDLELAINHANSKYSDIWEFNDELVKPESSGGGCSTCVAH